MAEISYIPDNNQGTANALMAMIPSLCQQRGLDPNTVLAACKDRNGAWSDLIALVIVAAIFGFGGNGYGGGLFGGRGGGYGGFVPNMINNDSNTQLLMQMLQRNGADITTLAAAANTSSDAIMSAVNGVSKEICNLGINSGQNFNQVLTALMQGNNSISTQLANCCCTLRDAITQQGYQSQLGQKDIQNAMQFGFNQSQVGVERGFSQTNYQMATDTCDIKQNTTDNTGRILAKLDAIEDSRKDREINALTAENASLRARAERQAENTANFTPIFQRLSEIERKQPNTVNVPWPQLTAIPTYLAAAYQGYGFPGAFSVPQGNVFS